MMRAMLVAGALVTVLALRDARPVPAPVVPLVMVRGGRYRLAIDRDMAPEQLAEVLGWPAIHVTRAGPGAFDVVPAKTTPIEVVRSALGRIGASIVTAAPLDRFGDPIL